MAQILQDRLNLKILENICTGTGVAININAVANEVDKHRTTVKKRIEKMIRYRILNEPRYPFKWLYHEYPLLVIARTQLPKTSKIETFITNDDHIFAGFFVRDEEFNTLLFQYHKDIYSYGMWKKKIVKQKMVPPTKYRYPAHAHFFSMKRLIKFQPDASLAVIGRMYENGQEPQLNGYALDELSYQILNVLVSGRGIRTNESLLAGKLDVHRKTIERRIEALLDADVIAPPVCPFPNSILPPDHYLVYSLLEIRKSKRKMINALAADPNILVAIEANVGRYNMLLLESFYEIESHFEWEQRYDAEFPNAIGAMKKILLAPQMTVAMDETKITRAIIHKRKKELKREGS